MAKQYNKLWDKVKKHKIKKSKSIMKLLYAIEDRVEIMEMIYRVHKGRRKNNEYL